MTTTTDTPPAGASTPDPAANGDGKDKDEERRPYVVVLMSAEMKAALKEYASAHDTNPTALGRKLFAEAIGYDISKEPVPTSTRATYADDASRAAAKKRASLKSGLLRKALFQVHSAQLKKRPLLLAAANAAVLAISQDDKISAEDLDTLDNALDVAIKAGK